MAIFIFAICIIVFIISIPIYFSYKDKKYYEQIAKENEEWERKMNDPEYREKRLNEFLDNIDHFNKNYTPGMNLDPPSSFTTSSHKSTYDEFNDPLSPFCPWGFWSM